VEATSYVLRVLRRDLAMGLSSDAPARRGGHAGTPTSRRIAPESPHSSSSASLASSSSSAANTLSGRASEPGRTFSRPQPSSGACATPSPDRRRSSCHRSGRRTRPMPPQRAGPSQGPAQMLSDCLGRGFVLLCGRGWLCPPHSVSSASGRGVLAGSRPGAGGRNLRVRGPCPARGGGASALPGRTHPPGAGHRSGTGAEGPYTARGRFAAQQAQRIRSVPLTPVRFRR
jgi:hypothetical protein